MEVKPEVYSDDDDSDQDDFFNENDEESDIEDKEKHAFRKDESDVKGFELSKSTNRQKPVRRWKARSHVRKVCGKLPPGWRKTWHSSGIVVYYHRDTNTCTLSRPFLVGNAGTTVPEFKKILYQTLIPNWSIPCLHYQKQNERRHADSAVNISKSKSEKDETSELKQENEELDSTKLVQKYCCDAAREKNVGSCETAEVEVKKTDCKQLCKIDDNSLEESKYRASHVVGRDLKLDKEKIAKPKPGQMKLVLNTLLNPDEIHDYCSKLFDFIQIERKIKVDAQAGHKSEPVEKLCKLVEAEFKKKVVYKYTCDNIFHKFGLLNIWKCCVFIAEKEWGVGYGTNKGEAQDNASISTLKILFPMEKEIKSEPIFVHPRFPKLFEGVDLHYEHMKTLCIQINEPSPLKMLWHYLFMKHGTKARSFISMERINNGRDGKMIRLTYGDKQLKVESTAAIQFKQRHEIAQNVAAQIMLTKLHTDVTDFSQFVKMYGRIVFSEFLKNANF